MKKKGMSHQARVYRVSTSEKKEKEKKKKSSHFSLIQIKKLIGDKKVNIYKVYQRNASICKSHKFWASLLKVCAFTSTHMCMLCLAHVYASLKH